MAAARKIEKSATAFRSIGEAARELSLETHVLRYWETKFPRIVKPVKRADGRRMFRPKDMDALRAIQLLVHKLGFTLKGANAFLKEQGVEAVLMGDVNLFSTSKIAESPARALQESIASAFGADMPNTVVTESSRKKLQNTLLELKDLKARIDKVRTTRAA